MPSTMLLTIMFPLLIIKPSFDLMASVDFALTVRVPDCADAPVIARFSLLKSAPSLSLSTPSKGVGSAVVDNQNRFKTVLYINWSVVG